MNITEHDEDSAGLRDRQRRLRNMRSSSLDKSQFSRQSSKNVEESKKASMPALFNLQATDVEDDDVIGRKQRAMTD